MALLQVTAERPDAKITELLEAVKRAALEQFKPAQWEGEYPNDGFGLQILRPRNVGLAKDYWQMTVTTSYADWINSTLGTDNYDVVTGVFNLSIDPKTTELFPSSNGKDLPIVMIESLYANSESALGWFSRPFATKPSSNITIQAIGRLAGTERLGLDGYTVGKRSYLINKTAA